MKTRNLLILISLLVGWWAQAQTKISPQFFCQASDGSRFIFDNFDSDPCRIRRQWGESDSLLENVNLCIPPDDVHSDFSFWQIKSNQRKAYFVAHLEIQEDGTLSGQYNLGDPEREDFWIKLSCRSEN